MKKGKLSKALAILLSALLFMMIAAPAAQTFAAGSEYRYLWTAETEAIQAYDNGKYQNLYQHHRALGNANFDPDFFFNGELGDSIIGNFYYFLNYTDEMHPDVLRYWEEDMHTRKEMHNERGEARKWVSYTPLEALQPGNTKKYPVVIVMHGSGNTTFMTETYGYAQLAAEKGFICIIPWADNATTYAEDLPWIMDTLRADYPIDESRVYGAGFSLGGRSVIQEAIRFPDLFAAINVGGQPLAGTRSASSPIPASDWAKLHDLPILQMCGGVEQNSQLPYGINRVIGGELQVEALNIWFGINGVKGHNTTLAECLNLTATSADPAVKNLGLIGDKNYTVRMDGTNYYHADYFNEDHVNMVKVVAIEGQPHWLSGSYASIVWDFFSQFARDKETNEMVVLKDDKLPLSVEGGNTVVMPIRAVDCEDFAGMSGTVRYNKELLTLEGISAKKSFTLTADGDSFVVVTPDGAGVSGETIVGYAIFRAEADLEDDVTTYVWIENINAYNADLQSISLDIPDTPIQVLAESPLTGDVNLDGKVDVADAILLMQYLAGSKTLTSRQLRAADANKDSKVNVGDVTIIMQMCL